MGAHWEDQKAAAMAKVAAAEETLVELPDDHPFEADDIAALTTALAEAKARLADAPALLVPPEAVGQIDAGAAHLTALLTTGTGDPVHSIIGRLVTGASLITFLGGGADDVGVGAVDVMSAARERLSAMSAVAEAQERARGEAHEALSEKADAARSDLDGLRKALSDLESKHHMTQESIEKALTTQATDFRDQEKARSNKFSEEMETWETGVKDSLKEWGEDASGLLDEMQKMRDDSAALVGATAVALTAERFGEQVERERKTANQLRIAAVGAISLAGLIAFWVAHTSDVGSDWRQFSGKVLAGLVFATAAGYLARQSSQHRGREAKYRQLSLELRAFGPFVEPLDEDQKRAARIVMADRVFGRHIEGLPPPDGDMPSLVDKILEMLKRPRKDDPS